MTDNELRDLLRDGLREADESQMPGFAETWSAAEASHRRSRQRTRTIGSAAAAVAIIAVVAGYWQENRLVNIDEFLIASSLLNSTHWQAPSDALLPEYRDDIYGEMPSLLESTEIHEGPML